MLEAWKSNDNSLVRNYNVVANITNTKNYAWTRRTELMAVG